MTNQGVKFPLPSGGQFSPAVDNNLRNYTPGDSYHQDSTVRKPADSRSCATGSRNRAVYPLRTRSSRLSLSSGMRPSGLMLGFVDDEA
jgi:hypothetical protein